MVPQAEECARAAEDIFHRHEFDEGIAYANRVWGAIRRTQNRFEEANRKLRAALIHFQKNREQAEAARTHLEIARTQYAASAPHPLVKNLYLEALKTAEVCRRFQLIREIEEELKTVDFEAYCVHAFRRVRGRDVSVDTTSLIMGELKPASILYLDLIGSTDYALGRSPEEVMMTLNQMMSDFVAVLRKHDAHVSGFRGDGFLAILLEADHAIRAVAAGLDLFQELEKFNDPRKVLDLELFVARIGIASGDIFLGNVGTYDKMDYTAIGTTANLGARLESNAKPGKPCISWQTHDLVRDRFRYSKESPRTVDLKGLGATQMWDVEGWA
jgi:class 3 adenylate cyclase